jgi:PEGA domain
MLFSARYWFAIQQMGVFMKKLFAVAALATMSLGLGGCATVLNGTSQDLSFQSDPDGAVIAIADGRTCTTPCEFGMKRGDDTSVTFTKEGYKTTTLFIQSRTGASTFGNILAGGIIGGVVDGSNGASNHLYPNPAYVKLAPNDSSAEAILLDKKGAEISTVAAYNDKVREDVEKGMEKKGLKAKKSKK